MSRRRDRRDRSRTSGARPTEVGCRASAEASDGGWPEPIANRTPLKPIDLTPVRATRRAGRPRVAIRHLHHAALSISAARFAISQSTPSKLSMCVEKGQAFPVLTSREIPHRAERPREDALPAPAGRSAWSDGIYQRPRRLEFGLAVACIGR